MAGGNGEGMECDREECEGKEGEQGRVFPGQRRACAFALPLALLLLMAIRHTYINYLQSSP